MVATGEHMDESLLTPGGIQHRLQASVRSGPPFETRIALWCEGTCQFAASGVGPEEAVSVAHQPMWLGCITKLFIGTLICEAVATRRLSLSDPLLAIVNPDPAGEHCLQGITIQDLLNHTYGLDDSAIPAAPLRADGCVDFPTLCTSLGRTALFAPGEHYSYGSFGAWALAAALERLYGCSIPDILRERLLTPLNLTPRLETNDSAGWLCPATGGRFALTMGDVMRFLIAHLQEREAQWLGGAHSLVLSSQARALPGMSSSEVGVRLGWKDYGSGWYGHQSVMTGAPALARVHPQRRIAYLVSCSNRLPVSVAAAVFGRMYPESLSRPVPQILSDSELESLDLEPYTGVFANAAERILVDRDEARRLVLTTVPSDSRQSSRTTRTIAARNGIFLSSPLDLRLPFAQFLAPTQAGCSLLWNGVSLRPRVAQCPTASS